MEKVKVFCDSTADIPQYLIEELDIKVIPVKVQVAGESYLDRVTITPGQFYEKMKSTPELPMTSQPSPVEITEAYRQAIEAGATEILSIHISSKMSGTYQTALLAKSMIEEEYPEARIVVVDSRAVTYALGVLVVMAARAAKEGKSMAELQELVQRIRDKQVLVALVDTLEYLQKGGRIGKASALVGSLLNIKPIISINDDGEIYAIEKARGKNKAQAKAFELLKEKVPTGAVSAAILHADEEEQAEIWLEKAKEMFDVREVVVVDLGPAVGTHAGPGTIGCLLVPLDE
ncbi:DegV family protein [Laceyella putida]|uniref:DegV family protein n=1 Tax=Laceyella putida TaxID=110101 RepID=A0ABW2RN01_9BACL